MEFRNRVPSEIPEARRPALRDRRDRRCDEHERYDWNSCSASLLHDRTRLAEQPVRDRASAWTLTVSRGEPILTGPAPASLSKRLKPNQNDVSGDDDQPRGTRLPQRSSAAPALADVHGSVGLRLRARLVLRPVSPDAGERQDLYFRNHLRAVRRGHAALLPAHGDDLARDRQRATGIRAREQGRARPARGRHGRRGRRRHAASRRAGHHAYPQPYSQGDAAGGGTGSIRPCCCAGWPTRCAVPTSSARLPATH